MSAERMLWENDATGLAELLHRGEISPPDLVDAAIARAEATRSLRIRRLPARHGPEGGRRAHRNLLEKLHLTRALEIRSLFGRLMDKSLWFTTGRRSRMACRSASRPSAAPATSRTLLSLAAQMEKVSGWLTRRAPLKVPA
ncbi:hypothetical protein X758_29025 [Mesorhizobium sp. LSHC416B00]|nr:hypothetical protein X758_29025 [Mesorhizobium sp. LSHC416B00]